ncbi:amidohydrolase family protein [Cohaesibacter celericrescens]|uniref:2-pyrone-4,6-dicarboxylate hydrolase n=1 Tax=Cohaesibacter celericrescens TaxID=2067669 RepID=A0A2N5XUT1_9HYPH|nr:amidohydrolase family protein [Cohaesibacter celericrescens]PLW78249.1 2-pyrone-4,6-dicarboxylate hydrolase [Cohaesibacter celericrescens]
MTPDYLPFHPDPKKPAFTPPSGAVDAHCHVFGPADVFPYAAERKYTPCDASKEQLFALRDHLGFSKNVIVQASCHGKNNDALLDALRSAGDKARGIAVVGPDISKAELLDMHAAGVRGVRFNFVKRLVDDTPREVFRAIVDKIKPLGWHIIVYFEPQDLHDLVPFLISLDITVVIDHMGRVDVSKGLSGQDFQEFVALLKEHDNFWTKVSCPERLSVKGPPYDDVIPFAHYLVEHFPTRVLWGTDWPHPNMKSHMPDDGALTDVIPLIAPTEQAQKLLLVDNPNSLYWAE